MHFWHTVQSVCLAKKMKKRVKKTISQALRALKSVGTLNEDKLVFNFMNGSYDFLGLFLSFTAKWVCKHIFALFSSNYNAQLQIWTSAVIFRVTDGISWLDRRRWWKFMGSSNYYSNTYFTSRTFFPSFTVTSSPSSSMPSVLRPSI